MDMLGLLYFCLGPGLSVLTDLVTTFLQPLQEPRILIWGEVATGTLLGNSNKQEKPKKKVSMEICEMHWVAVLRFFCHPVSAPVLGESIHCGVLL